MKGLEQYEEDSQEDQGESNAAEGQVSVSQVERKLGSNEQLLKEYKKDTNM